MSVGSIPNGISCGSTQAQLPLYTSSALSLVFSLTSHLHLLPLHGPLITCRAFFVRLSVSIHFPRLSKELHLYRICFCWYVCYAFHYESH